MKRLAPPLHRRPEELRRGRPDDGAAMMLVILLMLLISGMVLVVTAAVVQRATPMALLQKRTQTVSAAESGIDAALTQIRTASGSADAAGNVSGDAARLPCGVSGSVGAAAAGASYSVAVAYFGQDPTGRDAAWRTANRLAWCTPSGASTGAPRTVTPRYAVLTAQGSGPAVAGSGDAAVGNRVLESVYTFKVSNAHLLGGLMYAFSRDYCIEADSAAAGSFVTYRAAATCEQRSALQLFQWDPDYRIRLSSTTVPGSTPLCLTGAYGGTVRVTLQPCSSADHRQLFSYLGGTTLWGQNATNTGRSASCLGAGVTDADLQGRRLVSWETCWGDRVSWGTWNPESRFGAGAAGYATHQITNDAQFGRCFDIAYESTANGFQFLYPCKQDPSGRGDIVWNQKVYYTESTSERQPITIFDASRGATACLTTPAAGQRQPALPTFTACTGSAAQQWLRTGAAAGSSASYAFIDAHGRCMGFGPLDRGNLGSMVTVDACDGSSAQKWNAPSQVVDSGVGGLREVARG